MFDLWTAAPTHPNGAIPERHQTRVVQNPSAARPERHYTFGPISLFCYPACAFGRAGGGWWRRDCVWGCVGGGWRVLCYPVCAFGGAEGWVVAPRSYLGFFG